MKRITVLIVDDHTIVRQGLRHLLETAPDIQVLAEAENGREALQQAAKLLPDVILLDLAMPELHGIDAARLISKKVPSAKVLILSMYSESREVHAAIEAGAIGFVMKQTAANELFKAIRETSKGNAYFSPEISEHLLNQTRDAVRYSKQKSKSGSSLTRRETEVLLLVAQGNSNKEIAAALLLSIKTVEKHRQSLMKKTRIHKAAGLTRYAISTGAIACDRPGLIQRLTRPAAQTDRPEERTLLVAPSEDNVVRGR
jgi:DNA-binding NarL/FixJ family response regulator